MKDSREQTACSRQGKTKGFLSTIYCLLSTKKGLLSTKSGFTLVELLITMVIFVLVLAAASGIFTSLLTQFKQQSKIAESNIEGIVGLDIFRQDIEQAGYGLPWNVFGGAAWTTLTTYDEATSADFNDGNPASALPAPAGTRRAPRAFVVGDNTGLNGSDYLVIKSVTVAANEATNRWNLLSSVSPYTNTWTPDENLVGSYRVTVLSPGITTERALVVSGTTFSTLYSNVTNTPWRPLDASETRIVYGVDSNSDLRMPFNRADYYISTSNVPARCATNTGVLMKGVVDNSTGGGSITTFLPLLDCVADMQVNFWLDTDNDGNINWPPSDSITGLTAQQIRDQLKEVRIYIVAHEGQRDMNYDFSMNNTREFLSAIEVLGANSRAINFVNLKTLVGDPDCKYYRWKVYTLVVKPQNLR